MAALYSLSVLFLLIALLFAFAGHRKKIVAKNRGVAIGGDNSGMINTGKVGGNINASVSTVHNRTEAKESPSISMKLLNIMAALSGIASAVLAALAYFLPPTGA